MLFPNDQSTVFSIVPSAINEFKPGIYPGIFKIPACTDDRKPERLVVSASMHLMTVGGKKQPIQIETASYVVAKAIVDDFLDGQLYTTPDARPGICWIQGNIPVDLFLKERADMMERMQIQQRKWFILLIQKTEDDWKKYKNSRVVTDQARFAVRALGIPTPEWMTTEEVGMNFTKCPACSTMNDPVNVVCSSCSVLFTKELLGAKTREEKLANLKFAGSAR